jgi:hypothetical protein
LLECLSLMREECPCDASNEYEVIEVRAPHIHVTDFPMRPANNQFDGTS